MKSSTIEKRRKQVQRSMMLGARVRIERRRSSSMLNAI
jgi:hypothetical protein